MRDRPQARTEGVISEVVGDDVVVYDQVTHTAHSLSAAAASVWNLCDGKRSAEDIADALSMKLAMVAQAIADLSDCGLLDDSPLASSVGISRREAAKRLVQVGGAAFAAPLIYSVAIAPAIAAASTCSLAVGATPTNCSAVAGGFGSSVIVGTAKGTTCCASGSCYRGRFNSTYYCVAAGDTCVRDDGTCTKDSDCCDPATGNCGARRAGQCEN
ncbi:MAG TPA: PqqD family peptide modification chaperone [Solirubrobacteraceae bacterium]